MRHRTSVVLLILFVTGLCVLWWADYADVPTREKQQELLNRLLPELYDLPVPEVWRIEVDRRSGPLKDRVVVERRDDGGWQLREPVDAAADPELVETLARNLKDLRKSADAGTIHGDPSTYGLATPESVVTIFVKAKKEPVATLDLGTTSKDRLYVRPGAGAGIEVVDQRPLSALALPAIRWRDTALFHVPSFRVKGVTIRESKPDVEIALERADRNWRLTSPFKVPADNDRAEGLVAELSALRLTDGDASFVANGVRDRAPYGLDAPTMTVTVTPFENSGKPQTLLIGKGVPGNADEVYAMRADQDDVVRLDVKRLREAIPGPNGLRSQTVLDLNPGRIDRVRIESSEALFDLIRTRSGWRLLSPASDPADNARVQALLMRLSELKSSEFLDPGAVTDPRLDPPHFRVRGWQVVASGTPVSTDPKAEPKQEPIFDLSLGRQDALRKSVYGRIAGDTTVLALPESILDVMPRNVFAFRDRRILTHQPTEFASVTVERGRSAVTVEPPPTVGATGMHWRMTEPVAAPTDDAAVTTLLLTLGNLRAESWESARVGDGKEYGLDAPVIRVKWTLHGGKPSPRNASTGDRKGSLRIGKAKPNGGSVYANIEGEPEVFTLNPGVIEPLEAELHSRKVVGFKADDAEQVVLAWPSRTIVLEKKFLGPVRTSGWVVSPSSDPAGFDVAQVDAIVARLADLKTPRFSQYSGPIPAVTGLGEPTVSVRVKVAGKAVGATLRVGKSINPTTYLATSAEGGEGPVFVLPADDCKLFLNPPTRPGDIPADVFAPEPHASKPPG